MPRPSPASGALQAAIAAEVLSPETDPTLRAAVARLAAVCGPMLDGLVFFGSRRTGAALTNAWSAYDLFAVVEAYHPFFAALHRGGLVRRRPRWLALLGGILPPTQISLRFADLELHAKVSVIRRDGFLRETSARRHDHFTIGRLFQPSRIVYARTDAVREELHDALVSACRETWRWARPWLPASFDIESYGRQTLAISMSWEVRPEPAGRAAALWAAQREAQLPILSVLLQDLAAGGALRPTNESRQSWTIAHPVGRGERLRWRLYFVRSLCRATLRWAKHMLTFEDWLEYIVRKASRHTGERFELSARERRWPLLFLWGRLFRYLRDKDRKGVAS
jgi:hypothetical protein